MASSIDNHELDTSHKSSWWAFYRQACDSFSIPGSKQAIEPEQHMHQQVRNFYKTNTECDGDYN